MSTETTTIDRRETNWPYLIAGQAGVVGLVMGEPGTAKTALTRSLALLVGRNYHALLLDQELPEDMGGYKYKDAIDVDGRSYDVMKSVMDERLVRCHLVPSILHIDELTNVGHAQQAAALGLMNEGIPGTWIFASANPVHQATAGCALAPAMVNRLCVLEWEIPVAAIREGWRNNLNFPEPTMPVLQDDWMDHSKVWFAHLDQFAERNPILMQKCPEDATQASEPWPSFRSWTNAGKLLGAATSVGASRDTHQKLVTGCVGEGACKEFFNWLSKQDLPNPEEILARPESFQIPRRADLAMAVAASVVNAVRENKTGERWEAARDFIEHAYKTSPEVATVAESRLWKFKPDGYETRVRTSEIAKEMRANRLGK